MVPSSPDINCIGRGVLSAIPENATLTVRKLDAKSHNPIIECPPCCLHASGWPRGRGELPAEQGADHHRGPRQQPRILAPHEGRPPGQDQVLKATPLLR